MRHLRVRECVLDRTGATGKPNARRAQYVCTAEGCPARASIGAAQLDAYVDSLLMQSRSQEHLPQTMPLPEAGEAAAEKLASTADMARAGEPNLAWPYSLRLARTPERTGSGKALRAARLRCDRHAHELPAVVRAGGRDRRPLRLEACALGRPGVAEHALAPAHAGTMQESLFSCKTPSRCGRS